MIRRREMIAGAIILCLALPHAARARPKKVTRERKTAQGRTLWMKLDNAPFPCKPLPYINREVIVFVPARWRPPADGRVDLLVYFHGHHSTAHKALEGMHLRQQLAASGGSSLLVIPQLAFNAAESHAGRLERRGGLRRLLHETLAILARRRLVPVKARPGRVRLAAHSGGFQAAAMSLARGRVPVSEVYLFDAMYGFAHVFTGWLAADPSRKLVSFFRGSNSKVVTWTRRLQAGLDRRRVSWIQETRPGAVSKTTLSRARAVFFLTSVGHMEIPWRHGVLRDCLRASR